MAPVTIRKEIQIDAPVDTVWQFVGTQEGLRRWWETDIQFEAREGGRCVEQVASGGTWHRLSGTVTRYDPPHEIGFSLRTGSTLYEDDRPDDHALPSRSTVSIQLERAAQGTTVKIAHRIEGDLIDAFSADAAEPVMSLSTSGSPYMSLPLRPLPLQPLPFRYGTHAMNAGVLCWQPQYNEQWAQRLATLKSIIAEPVLQA